ncbi:hypothetical protein ZIOFF_001145 [Zingiber officinale]|uniref:Uncharacterized protein n=1 Tax=Zingiber officinale TaxID=94328 RepID=A0A8J5LY93_ZINOF|nr:hypothetical protein ZIOFF_001145 [Zingiber officinale]
MEMSKSFVDKVDSDYVDTGQLQRSFSLTLEKSKVAHQTGLQNVLPSGDFNVISGLNEHSIGILAKLGAIREFNKFVMLFGLLDVGFVDDSFTWNNNKVWKRLDRVLLSPTWSANDFGVQIEHLKVVDVVIQRGGVDRMFCKSSPDGIFSMKSAWNCDRSHGQLVEMGAVTWIMLAKHGVIGMGSNVRAELVAILKGSCMGFVRLLDFFSSKVEFCGLGVVCVWFYASLAFKIHEGMFFVWLCSVDVIIAYMNFWHTYFDGWIAVYLQMKYRKHLGLQDSFWDFFCIYTRSLFTVYDRVLALRSYFCDVFGFIVVLVVFYLGFEYVVILLEVQDPGLIWVG